MDVSTFILSLLGAGAWIPIIATYLKKSKLEFKLVHCNFMNNFTIDLYSPDNEKVETKQKMQCVTLGFILTTYNRRNVVTDIYANIKMKTGNELRGNPHTKTLHFTNKDKSKGRLTIPGNMNILVNSDLPPDTSTLFYCNFLFDYPNELKFKEIEFITVVIQYRSKGKCSKKHIVLDNNMIINAAHINYVEGIYTIINN